MSDLTLVHDVAVNGPATHAIVIGVGSYTHLPGGDPAAQMADPDGMAQLTSPPVSARAVADWLISDYNSDKEIATVSLLLSETDGQPYRNRRTGVDHTVQVANASNVEDAIVKWSDRADQDVANRTIFYFCGHGISAGVTTSLLLADFGGLPANKFKGALDFDQLNRGMESIKAAEQLFVVDACRVATPRLLAGATFVGIVPLAGTERDRSLVRRQSASLFSTILGAKAYGLPSQPSVFTSALITALKGAGSLESEEDGERWQVDTALLKRAIDRLLKRRAEMGPDGPPPQLASARELMTFPIHDVVGPPKVPVFVRCVDQSENELAKFACRKGTDEVGSREIGHSEDWEFEVEHGAYEITASFPSTGRQRSSGTRVFRPAFGDVKLEPQ